MGSAGTYQQQEPYLQRSGRRPQGPIRSAVFIEVGVGMPSIRRHAYLPYLYLDPQAYTRDLPKVSIRRLSYPYHRDLATLRPSLYSLQKLATRYA